MNMRREPDVFEKSIITKEYLYWELQKTNVYGEVKPCERCGAQPAATVTELIDPNRPRDSEKWGDDETWEVTTYRRHDFTHLFGPLCLSCIRQLWTESNGDRDNEGGDEQ